DVLVVLGGDGTILRTARRVSSLNVPLLTVNLGKVGFMAELEPEEIEDYIDPLLKQDFRLERRMMLHVSVTRDGREVFSSDALNEAVVIRHAHMSDLRVCIDGEFFSDYVADGLICATPTGSTAYSLAAGGPTVMADMEAILLTPVCAYMLALKPLVIDARKIVTIHPEAKGETWLMVDGQEKITLQAGDKVEIKRSERGISLIKFKRRAFYEFLGKKLYRSRA
ncbi:MAG: NAD(+)/NADH kinase, partial [Candidatus Saccharibacteria bacterium]